MQKCGRSGRSFVALRTTGSDCHSLNGRPRNDIGFVPAVVVWCAFADAHKDDGVIGLDAEVHTFLDHKAFALNEFRVRNYGFVVRHRFVDSI
jgi:hypothetical protein